MNSTPPLIVDLDGSLLRTDSLHESVAGALRRPGILFGALWQFGRHGRAALKKHLAAASIDVDLLPANQDVVAFLRAERKVGRKIYLATGADSRFAKAIIERFPEFDGSFASDGRNNLTSSNKADLLVREFGAKGFDYIGNSAKDRAVWLQADRSYLVTSSPASGSLPRWARSMSFAGIFRENTRSSWQTWLRELRVHQSLKNLLLFLPILAAHKFDDKTAILLAVAGFVIFTFMASSVYLLNDLLDLRSDRLHPTKALRPLAAGRILPIHALICSIMLAVIALVGGFFISVGFALVLILYAVLTCLYSFLLKRVTLVDVLVLAMLYMIRIFAGAVLAHIQLSFWFTGVALFLFLSLALVKRYTELSRHSVTDQNHQLPGRGYSRVDAAVILPLGLGAGTAVLILMAIYLQSSSVALIYPSGGILWLVIPAMFYWLGNIWIQAGRGTIHDDPIIFALKNRASLISAVIIVTLFVAASTSLEEVATHVFRQLNNR